MLYDNKLKVKVNFYVFFIDDFYIIVYGPLNLIQVFSLYLTNIISPYFNHFTGSQPLTDNNNRNRPQQKLVSLKVYSVYTTYWEVKSKLNPVSNLLRLSWPGGKNFLGLGVVVVPAKKAGWMGCCLAGCCCLTGWRAPAR